MSANDLCDALTTSSNVTRGMFDMIDKTVNDSNIIDRTIVMNSVLQIGRIVLINTIDKIVIFVMFYIQEKQLVGRILWNNHKTVETQWPR